MKYYNMCLNGSDCFRGYEIEVSTLRMIINNIDGVVNEEVIEEYEKDTYMMKFNEVRITETY